MLLLWTSHDNITIHVNIANIINIALSIAYSTEISGRLQMLNHGSCQILNICL